jgi:hypothetical protein
MSDVQFTFGEYTFDLVELAQELEDPALSTWAQDAVRDGRFRFWLRARAQPLLDQETADNPLDVMGEGAATILKSVLAYDYKRRDELPFTFIDPKRPESAPPAPGPRSRQSELAERLAD